MRELFLLPFSLVKQPAWYGPVGYLTSMLGVALATGLLWLAQPILNIGGVYLIYLVIVVMIAVGWGLKPAVLASVLSFLAANFFFIPPIFTFSIANAQDVLALIIFLGLATLTSQLVARLRREAQEARHSQQITATLYELSRTINRQRKLQPLLESVCGQLQGALNLEACIISLKTDEDAPPLLAAMGTPLSDEKTGADVTVTPIGSAEMQLGYLHTTFVLPHKATSEEHLLLAAFAEQLFVAAEHVRLQQLETQTEVLRRTDELRVGLLSAVAHDLRTPLGSIETAATSILSPNLHLSSQDQKEFLEAVVGEVGRINRLISNLLDVSRIEAGRLSPQKAPHKIEDVINTVLERLQLRLNGHVIDTRIEENLPVFAFDAVEIDAVLTNLLENALKYTPAGTHIHVRARRTGGDGCTPSMVEVAVSDEGKGVSAEYLPQLFNRFYRMTDDTTANVQGTGLGLYIAKGIVEAHKGQIRASNGLAGGLTVSFTLPVQTQSNPEGSAQSNTKLAARTA